MISSIHIHEEDPAIRVLLLKEYPDQPIYVLVPAAYRDDRPTGLFFFMHGGDHASTPDQPYKTYLNTGNGCLRPHLANFPYLTVAPAALPAVDGKRWNRAGVSDYILAVIEGVKEHFSVDPGRMILGGHSMGGFGAYHQGALLGEHFAGIWCSAGAFQAEDFRSMEGTAVYLAHGKYDCAFHYKGAHVEPRHHDWCGVSFGRAAHELMNRYGIDHVYDEHDGGHTLDWEPAQMALCRFLQWAVRQKRNPYPRRCSLVTPNGSYDPDLENVTSSRYLEIVQAEKGKNILLDKIVLTGPNVAWTIDELNAQSYYLDHRAVEGAFLQAENMGNNLFRIQCCNVRQFRLRLHPAMADLTKAVRIRLNDEKEERLLMPEPDGSHKDYTAGICVNVNA